MRRLLRPAVGAEPELVGLDVLVDASRVVGLRAAVAVAADQLPAAPAEPAQVVPVLSQREQTFEPPI